MHDFQCPYCNRRDTDYERGRSEVSAKVKALADQYAAMSAVLHDIRAADVYASVEMDLRALIAEVTG